MTESKVRAFGARHIRPAQADPVEGGEIADELAALFPDVSPSVRPALQSTIDALYARADSVIPPEERDEIALRLARLIHSSRGLVIRDIIVLNDELMGARAQFDLEIDGTPHQFHWQLDTRGELDAGPAEVELPTAATSQALAHAERTGIDLRASLVAAWQRRSINERGLRTDGSCSQRTGAG